MATSQISHAHRVKVVVEHVEDGYVAYPLGMKGVVVGQGDSYRGGIVGCTSAIHAHVEEFGAECFSDASPASEAFIAEAEVF